MDPDRARLPALGQVQPKSTPDLRRGLPPSEDLGHERALPALDRLARGLGQESTDVGHGDPGPAQEHHQLGVIQLSRVVVAVAR